MTDQGNEEERLTWLLEAQQQARAEAEDALEYVQDIVGTLREPFLIMDENLQVLDANESFYEHFQVTQEETIGRMLYELGNSQWDIPQLREALEQVMTHSHRLTDFEVTHHFPSIGRRAMLLNARRIRRDHLPKPRDRILLAIEDVTERRQAEERMAASEQRYRRLFETARDGILIIDFNTGKVMEANPFIETLLGYSREELLGKELWQIGLVEDSAAGQQMFQELQREGYIRYEHPLVAKDGQVIEVEIIGNVYVEAGEQVIQYNIRDITERKRAEEALRESERWLATALEQLPVGVGVIDPEGRVTLANPLWRVYVPSEVPSQDPVRRNRWRAFTEGSAPIPLNEWPGEQSLRGQSVPGMTFLYTLENGHEIWLRVSAAPLRVEGGRVVGAICTIEDISRQKQTEVELRRNEERLRKIVAADAVGVLFFDQATGRLLDANDTFLQMTGYTRGEVEAGDLDWRKMTPPEYVDESLRQLEQLKASGRLGPYEKEYYCKDGSRRWMLFSGASLGDGTVGEFCIDVTDRKRAEEALREADRQKDQFIAMLSHELRNPLAPITNALRLLRLAQGDASLQQEALGVLDRQVATITRLVDDLLDVSRVTSGRIQLQETDVDLNALVSGTADSFRPQMAERRHEFTVSLSDTPLWAHGDPIRLEQVVVNLLSNAVKYTPEGGRVSLTVEEEGGEALVRVRDSGIGVEANLLPHIFELFSQGERGLDRPQGGLGIGLPLVKRLVEMHGGTVTAKSEGPGKGSEFSVRLPTVPSPVPQQAPSPEKLVRPAARSLRVLLVDDVADTRRIFGRLLEKWGHQVRTVGDGPSALAVALEFRPDAVLLDIGLPGMDGYEVAKRLRQEPALQDAVLVAVTGYGHQVDHHRSQEARFDHHLVKPVAIDALQQIFAAIVDRGT